MILPIMLLGIVGCHSEKTDSPPNEDTIVEDLGESRLEVDVEYSIPPDTSRTSVITAFSYQFGSTATSNVTIEFFDQSPPPLETVESTGESGGCSVITTVYETSVGSPMFADAGTIRVSGGQSEVEIMFEDGLYGAYASGDSPLFFGGDTLKFTAAGGKEIPPFSTELRAPDGVVMLSPTFLPGITLKVPRSANLGLRWSGGLPGSEIRLSLVTNRSSTETVSIACTWPATAGEASIPKALLENLATGEGSLMVKTVTSAVTVVEGWGPVECEATTPATNSDGVPLDLSIEVE
jgi:hypothetical protein